MIGNENETDGDLTTRISIHQKYGETDMHQHILTVMDLHCKEIVLDVGCGNGIFTEKINECVKFFGKIHAFDISEDLVAEARVKNHQNDIIYFTHDANKPLACPDNTFDFVTCLHSIYYYNHFDDFIGEVRRLLKPGGKLIFTAPSHNNAYEIMHLVFAITGAFPEQSIEWRVKHHIIPEAYHQFGNIQLTRFKNRVVFKTPEPLIEYLKMTPYWYKLSQHQDRLTDYIREIIEKDNNFPMTKEVHIAQCQK